jgi:hypothetical protein
MRATGEDGEKRLTRATPPLRHRPLHPFPRPPAPCPSVQGTRSCPLISSWTTEACRPGAPAWRACRPPLCAPTAPPPPTSRCRGAGGEGGGGPLCVQADRAACPHFQARAARRQGKGSGGCAGTPASSRRAPRCTVLPPPSLPLHLHPCRRRRATGRTPPTAPTSRSAASRWAGEGRTDAQWARSPPTHVCLPTPRRTHPGGRALWLPVGHPGAALQGQRQPA